MKKFILLILLFSFILSCEKNSEKISISNQVTKTQYYDNEIFNESNQLIYGRWEYLFMTGGIGGFKYAPSYDYLEIVQYGIYGTIVDNKIKEIGRLIINKQDSSVTIIDFSPDDQYKTDTFSIQKSIQFIGKDTLILNDTFPDGFSSMYKRVK